MRRVVAWVVLGVAAAAVLTLYVVTNLSWYLNDRMDLGQPDIPFWPGGLAIMLDLLLIAPLLLGIVYGIFVGLCWALEEVTP